MSFVKFFKDISANDLNLVGGKGLSLGRMTNAGLSVPAGFVITTDLHKKSKTKDGIDEQIEAELLESFDKLAATRVAVRSSAISEDSETASWAGQFESYMNVGRDDLIKRLHDCWDSLEGARAYAETQGLQEADLVLAVVVQEMVDSEVSGVAFSVNPLNRDPNQIMIEATYGLGELLVQGMVTPDNYVMSKDNKSIISKNVVTKTNMLAYQDGETKEGAVEPSKQDQACLSDEQLVELSGLICQIEDYYQSPQDIEWALKDDEFFILQSRPITA